MLFKNFGKRKQNKNSIQISTFECKRENLTIRGTEYRPAGETLPIAIVSHGFMATQGTVIQYAKALADLGYAAFCFDFCGGCVVNGKSDGKTTEMSVLTEVRDLEAVISYTRSLTYTDSDSLLLMGCSQGGFVSALTAANPVNKVNKIVLFFPAFCIPDDARAGQMMFAKFDPYNIPEEFSCGPMKLGRCYPADVISLDPFKEIKSFNGHVLIVHGTNDIIVSVDYAKRAKEAYLETIPGGMSEQERVRLEIIPKGDHGFSKKHDLIAIGFLKDFAGK